MSKPLSTLDLGQRRAAMAKSLTVKPDSKVKAGLRLEVSNEASSSGGKTAALYLYGVISAYSWFSSCVSAKAVLEAIEELDADHLDVHIHSPGGDVFEAVAIFNALRNADATITTWIDGIAASAASYVAMAGDEIVMGQGTQLMIHDALMATYGNAAQLREDADWLDQQSQNIAGFYAKRAGGTADEWRDLMRAETWYAADEAVKAGLADRVSGDGDQAEDPDESAIATEDPVLEVDDTWDLSIFTYAGRAAAPAPAAIASRTPKPPTASADGSTHTEGGTAVAFSDAQITALRQKLGTAEDADEATILAALDEVLDEQAEPPADKGTSSSTAKLPEGTVLVDAATFEEMKRGAQAGQAASDQLANAARDQAITAAIEAGKIPANRREHWVKQWEVDAEGAAATLDSLEPGVIPLTERGHAQDTDTTEATDEAYSAYAAGLGI